MTPPAPAVSVGIVTWNSGHDIEACVAAVRAQRLEGLELLVADNGSSDETLERLEHVTSREERLGFGSNLGFAAAHNILIARSRGEFYLCLNPDAVLDADYAAILVDAMARRPDIGSATGKLLRRDAPGIIDSTGIVMTPALRHLDRSADQPDAGRYGATEEVFGASGAAALYRRAMLEDTRIADEYFDEDFFAYREDADLAWRAQLLGWGCLYVPSARALHGRRVTPERRADLPAAINRASVRNRFLLRLKNQPAGHFLRFLAPGTVRDLQVVAYVLLRERSSVPAFVDVVRLLPRMLQKRRAIMRRRKIRSKELARWFRGH